MVKHVILKVGVTLFLVIVRKKDQIVTLLFIIIMVLNRLYCWDWNRMLILILR